MTSLGVHQRLVRAAVSLLQPLRVGLRDAHSLHDVAGDVVAAEVDGAEVTNLSLVEDRDVGRAGAHLDESDAELLFVFGEHAERAGERLEHQLAHVVARPLDRFPQIHRRRSADGDEIHLRLEAGADHSDRVAHSGAAIHRVFLGNRVQQLAVLRNRLRAGDVVGAIDVRLGDLLAVHGDDAGGDHRADVLTGDSRIDALHLRARHPFGVLDRLLDRARRLFDVGDDSSAKSGRPRLPDA